MGLPSAIMTTGVVNKPTYGQKKSRPHQAAPVPRLPPSPSSLLCRRQSISSFLHQSRFQGPSRSPRLSHKLRVGKNCFEGAWMGLRERCSVLGQLYLHRGGWSLLHQADISHWFNREAKLCSFSSLCLGFVVADNVKGSCLRLTG